MSIEKIPFKFNSHLCHHVQMYIAMTFFLCAFAKKNWSWQKNILKMMAFFYNHGIFLYQIIHGIMCFHSQSWQIYFLDYGNIFLSNAKTGPYFKDSKRWTLYFVSIISVFCISNIKNGFSFFKRPICSAVLGGCAEGWSKRELLFAARRGRMVELSLKERAYGLTH